MLCCVWLGNENEANAMRFELVYTRKYIRKNMNFNHQDSAMKEDHNELTTLKLEQAPSVHAVKFGRTKILKTFLTMNKIND